MANCSICGKPTEIGMTECSRCWYGMRLDAEHWIEELKLEGIEVERGIGCVPFSGGIACGNPYKRKEQK